MYSLRTFGGLIVLRDGHPIHETGQQRKRLALLAMLAAAGPLGYPRDKLLACLWSDLGDVQARNAFNQLAHRIRRQLGDGVLSVTSSGVVLDSQILPSDIRAFHEALARQDLIAASEIYRGPFLDAFHLPGGGEFERWVEEEQRGLASCYTATLEHLATRATEYGDAAAAVTWWRQRAAVDPLNERIARKYIAALIAHNERDAALELVESHVRAVRDELGIDRGVDLRQFALELPTPRLPDERPDQTPLPETVRPTTALSAHQSDKHSSRRWGTRVGVAAIVVTVFIAALRTRETTVPPEVGTFTLGLADSVALNPEIYGSVIAISPQRPELVYVGRGRQLFRREFNSLVASPIAGTAGASFPEFSPDGQWVAFKSASHLYRVSRLGGARVMIADSVKRYAWGENGVIVFHATKRSGLWRTDPTTGSVRRLTAIDSATGEAMHTWPWVLPGGRAVLFNVVDARTGLPEVAATRIADGKIIHLGMHGWRPQFFGGVLLVSRLDGVVSAVAFDPEQLRITSGEVPVLKNVIGVSHVALSRTGTMAYVEGSMGGKLIAVDRKGQSRILLTTARGEFSGPRYSPDGRLIAYSIGKLEERDVAVLDLGSHSIRQLTSGGVNSDPEWLAGGDSLIWTTRLGGSPTVVSQSLASRGPSHPLFDGVVSAIPGPGNPPFALVEQRAAAWRSIDLLAPDDAHRGEPIPASRGSTYAPRISPDGRWLAYESDASGRPEIMLRASDGHGAALHVSGAGGHQPIWARSGRELFFRLNGQLMSAGFSDQSSPRITGVRALFTDTFDDSHPSPDYDVAPTGQEFIFTKRAAQNAQAIVKLGWLDAVRAQVLSPKHRRIDHTQ